MVVRGAGAGEPETGTGEPAPPPAALCVGDLPTARLPEGALVLLSPDDDLEHARMVMLENYFSQLPVMSGPHLAQIIRIFRQPDRWARLGWALHQDMFVTKLNTVRIIRNQVAHFRPDPITPEQRQQVEVFAGLPQEPRADPDVTLSAFRRGGRAGAWLLPVVFQVSQGGVGQGVSGGFAMRIVVQVMNLANSRAVRIRQ